MDLAPLVPAPLRPFLAGAGALESEHRLATIAFVLAGDLDARFEAERRSGAVAADLERCFGAAAAAADRHGVTLLDTDVTADGAVLFLAAGAPWRPARTRSGCCAPFATCSRSPRLSGCAFGPVSNRGPVFAGDFGAPSRRTYTAMGDTTNLAARIALALRRANSWRQLTSSPVRAVQFASEPLDGFTAKGKASRWCPSRRTAGRAPRLTPTRLPLTGRDDELDVLRDGLARARTGRGRPWRSSASRRRQIAAGRQSCSAEPGAIAPPGRPLLDVGGGDPVRRGPRSRSASSRASPPTPSPDEAGRRLAEPGSPMCCPTWRPGCRCSRSRSAPRSARRRMSTGWPRRSAATGSTPPWPTARRRAARSRGVVLEDLHWADEAILALLAALAESPPAANRLILALARPGPAAFGGPHGARIDLGTLDTDATVRLVLDAAAGSPLSDADLDAIVERAGGNPLFARELTAVAVRHGSAEALPDRLESLLASRIDRLDGRRRALLRRAAVLGRTVDLDLLDEVLADVDGVDHDLAAWADLEEFVAWEDPARIRFRHDLVRDAAYEGLSHARRRRLHQRLALAIERRAGRETDHVAGMLATHFAEGELPEPAFRYARRAGDVARTRYANVDAAAQYRRALACATGLDGASAVDRSRTSPSPLATSRSSAGRYDEAIARVRSGACPCPGVRGSRHHPRDG